MYTFIGNLQFFFISIVSFSLFSLISIEDNIEDTQLFICLIVFVFLSFSSSMWGKILDEEASVERIS